MSTPFHDEVPQGQPCEDLVQGFTDAMSSRAHATPGMSIPQTSLPALAFFKPFVCNVPCRLGV